MDQSKCRKKNYNYSKNQQKINYRNKTISFRNLCRCKSLKTADWIPVRLFLMRTLIKELVKKVRNR